MSETVQTLTQQFIQALHRLEDSGDLDGICTLFDRDAPLEAPGRTGRYRGPEGARQFWGEYRNSFSTIRSEFEQTVVGEHGAALFWTARGRLRHHPQEITYQGVTLLEFQGDRIAHMRTVFDRAPFQMAVQQRIRPAAR
ncbi:MAG TPA: nuclear transport factor 2 family protein [Dehalococcoidia bacterium]